MRTAGAFVALPAVLAQLRQAAEAQQGSADCKVESRNTAWQSTCCHRPICDQNIVCACSLPAQRDGVGLRGWGTLETAVYRGAT